MAFGGTLAGGLDSRVRPARITKVVAETALAAEAAQLMKCLLQFNQRFPGVIRLLILAREELFQQNGSPIS